MSLKATTVLREGHVIAVKEKKKGATERNEDEGIPPFSPLTRLLSGRFQGEVSECCRMQICQSADLLPPSMKAQLR